MPWSRSLFKKLIFPQLFNKYPIFYRTWRLITIFTRACYWSLYEARWNQPSSPRHGYGNIHSVTHLPYYFSLQVVWQNFAYISLPYHTCYILNPPRPLRFDNPNNIWRMYELWSSSICIFSFLLHFLLGPDLLPTILLSTTFKLHSSFNDTALFHSHRKQKIKLQCCIF